MSRCKACSHPDRAAIDGDLVRGISYRTVAGRYGLSVGTLHLHRAWHVLEPTLGDILEPGEIKGWQQWDGKRWLTISEPEREDLVEVSKGRPDRMCNRTKSVALRGGSGRRSHSEGLPAAPHSQAAAREAGATLETMGLVIRDRNWHVHYPLTNLPRHRRPLSPDGNNPTSARRVATVATNAGKYAE